MMSSKVLYLGATVEMYLDLVLWVHPSRSWEGWESEALLWQGGKKVFVKEDLFIICFSSS